MLIENIIVVLQIALYIVFLGWTIFNRDIVKKSYLKEMVSVFSNIAIIVNVAVIVRGLIGSENYIINIGKIIPLCISTILIIVLLIVLFVLDMKIIKTAVKFVDKELSIINMNIDQCINQGIIDFEEGSTLRSLVQEKSAVIGKLDNVIKMVVRDYFISLGYIVFLFYLGRKDYLPNVDFVVAGLMFWSVICLAMTIISILIVAIKQVKDRQHMFNTIFMDATSLSYVDNLCNIIEKWNLTQYDTDSQTIPDDTPSNLDTVTSFPATPFSVKVIIDDLNYRSEPSMNGKVNGQTGKGTFTIMEVKNGGWQVKSTL